MKQKLKQPLKGALVSIDAIACEIKNAELIVAGEGHYLLALKKNQAHLLEQVSERMQQRVVANIPGKCFIYKVIGLNYRLL